MTDKQRNDAALILRYGGAAIAAALAFASMRGKVEANTEHLTDHESRMRNMERVVYDLRADIKIIKAAVAGP